MGTPGRVEQIPTVTPEQSQLLQSLLGQLGGPLSSGIGNLQQILSGSPEALRAFQAPALRQFQEQIVPGIAERFSGLGAGSQRSSAFAQSLGSAGADLAERLAAQRANLQSGALSQLQGLLGTSMQSQFQNLQIPGQEGALQGLFRGLGSGLGGGLGALATGGLSFLL